MAKAATTTKRTKKTPIEDQLERQMVDEGITGYERQVRFIPGRRFEADFYFADLKLCVEIDGGVFMPRGGHTTGPGYTKDRERDITALRKGVLTVRYTSSQVRSGFAIETLKDILGLRARGEI
jgi:very-short-patch-repair endonuclease